MTAYTIFGFSSPSVSLGSVVSHDEFAKTVNIKKEILNNTLPIQEISAFTSALMIPFKDRKCLQEFFDRKFCV